MTTDHNNVVPGADSFDTGNGRGVPRPEYPRPQFERAHWVNLNGTWDYRFDWGRSGRARGWSAGWVSESERQTAAATGAGSSRAPGDSLAGGGRILVPFAPESRLSGVGHTDFIEAMWYQRQLAIPADWAGRRVLLHFGAVDYRADVYIDGSHAGAHVGGSVGFTVDVTQFVTPGREHRLVVEIRDEVRSGLQPGGKQNNEYVYKRNRCHYTRTTGIWQTVWMEAVHRRALRSVHTITNAETGSVSVVPRFWATAAGDRLTVEVVPGLVGSSAGAAAGTAAGPATGTAPGAARPVAVADGPAADGVPLQVTIADPRLWSPADPFLYGVRLIVRDKNGDAIDDVASYVGMRSVAVHDDRVLLNGRPLYQRLVLDQGFYPDGIWTAPSDADLRRDIELSMLAGFNGARLHQKVFEERFHYWADRLGYLTWGESASWGMRVTDPIAARNFLSEWADIVARDRNHPSIIAWTPFNETRDLAANPEEHHRLHRDAYDLTKSLDPTRPVNDASGYVHVRTDLWTVHNYEQDPQQLAAILDPVDGSYWRNFPDLEPPYAGQPYLIDEFGGILWIPAGVAPYDPNSWGYGQGPATEADFYERLAGMVERLLRNQRLSGYCYTQLTDVEQEQNGIYQYSRAAKFDMQRIRAIFSQRPEGFV